MFTGLADEAGLVTEKMIARYSRLAKGGAGLVILEAAAVNENSIASPVQLRIDSEKTIPGLRRLSTAIKKYGAVPGIQLFHAGRYALMGKELLSSSGIPLELLPETFLYPRKIEKAEIFKTIEDFGKAAERAVESGYDIVEIHGGGGYLISDFLSPRTNKRTDEFGSSLEGRLKFAVDIARTVRARIPATAVCGFRLMVDELMPEGVVFEDALVLAEQLIKVGVDYLNPLVGTHEAYIRDEISVRLKEPGFGISYSKVLKEAFPSVIVFANWGIRELDIAERALADNCCDAIALARPLLADPDFPLKAERGEEQRIIKCTSCYHCYYLALQGGEVRCKQWERPHLL